MMIDTDRLTAIREDYWAWERERERLDEIEATGKVGPGHYWASDDQAVDMLRALAGACGFNDRTPA